MFSELSEDLDQSIRRSADRLVADALAECMMSLSYSQDRSLALRGVADHWQSADMRRVRRIRHGADGGLLIATQR